MKRVTVAAVGLVAGLAASLLVSALGCETCHDIDRLGSDGTLLVADPGDAGITDTDYQLVISGNRTAVTESFARAGKHYVFRYAATFDPAD